MCSCVSPTSNASASHAEHNVLSEEFKFSLACSGGMAALLEAEFRETEQRFFNIYCMLESELLTTIHSVHNRYTALQVK